jgi:hypothetical protein
MSLMMSPDVRNRLPSNQQPQSLNDLDENNCAVFIAHFSDGYRVIYRMNGEWLLDALEETLTHARLKAERCLEAMLSSRKCARGTAKIYEITITADLSTDMKRGLRNPASDWQYFMTHAAGILNDFGHVHSVSFITDSDRDKRDEHNVPYLFVVSSKAFGNQHHINTVRLRKSRPSLKTAIIHEVSEGKAIWHSGDTLRECKVTVPVTLNRRRNHSILRSMTSRLQGILHPLKAGFGF